MQGIPRASNVSTHPIILHRDDDQIFEALYNHLVLTHVCSVIAPQQWNEIYDYIQWFYRVSHSCMTPDVEGEQSKSAHQEVLEEERAREDHVVNVLPIFLHIVVIWENEHKERRV